MRGVIPSPVLVGRDELLTRADQSLARAAEGQGGMLLLAGEAGIGKTRLLGTIARRAGRLDFTVLRAAAFPGDAEASGGVLLDLAGELRLSDDPELSAVGMSLSDRLRGPLPAQAGDAHRQRRLLIQDLSDGLSGLAAHRKILLVLEDLHWADLLSLDVAGHLAPRLATRGMLIAAAFRTDELYPRMPMRQWRSRLLTQRLADELRLPRLDRAQTATMVSAVLGDSAPARLVAAVFERSDGIPLHVEELLGALSAAADGGTDAGADAGTDAVRGGPGRSAEREIAAVPVPETLADAVLARLEGLDEETLRVAEAAAAIGRSFDVELLTAITGVSLPAVEGCLRRLSALYVVQPGVDAATFDFRHALIRDALYDRIDAGVRRDWHRRVAEAAVDRGYRDAFVSAHFERAGLDELVYRHALAAAREAAAMSAHHEAFELYQRAVRCQPADVSAADEARVLSELGDEAAAIDDNLAARTAYERAHELWVDAGDLIAAAGVVPRSVAVAHLLGAGLAQRVPPLMSEVDRLAWQPGAEPVLARLLSALSAAYMLDRRLDESLRFGQLSLELCGADVQTRLNTTVTLGAVNVFAGAMDLGWSLLENGTAEAVELHQEAEAARGFRMLGSCASVLVEYPRAREWLSRGMSYADGVELENHRNYMAAHLAHVEWACGNWARADQRARLCLSDGQGGVTTQITAEYVLGYLALGRADFAHATSLLTAALAQAEHMRELQRVSPPLWGLAETALLSGDLTACVEACERGYATSAEVADAAYLFPFAVTGMRAYLADEQLDSAEGWLKRIRRTLTARAIPGLLPALHHAEGLLRLSYGDITQAAELLREAAAGWQARDRFWEGTWALLDQARCAFRLRRRAEALSLVDSVRSRAGAAGAQSLLDAAEQLVAASSSRRPLQPWDPLSEREFQIARLVAGGNTNREIAAELVLSPKTVAAHVEHILTKLDMGRRTEIAVWVSRINSRDTP